MKLTEIGRDLIVITEADLGPECISETDNKIHLIKFAFESPTAEKVLTIIGKFPSTNRFIISDHIKIYNDILKTTAKKYYIQNRVNQDGLISFFRKNNKVFLSIPSLLYEDASFVLGHALDDILKNLEIIMIEQEDYERNIDSFRYWKGNVVLFDETKHTFIL